jgi:5-methylcytosine-specific restriction endonuclease McrA
VKRRIGKVGKKTRTPQWLTAEHKLEIRAIYVAAIRAGQHVDHIVPLRGGNVCGLHVPWNLQLMGPVENNRKGSRFTVADELLLTLAA